MNPIDSTAFTNSLGEMIELCKNSACLLQNLPDPNNIQPREDRNVNSKQARLVEEFTRTINQQHICPASNCPQRNRSFSRKSSLKRHFETTSTACGGNVSLIHK